MLEAIHVMGEECDVIMIYPRCYKIGFKSFDPLFDGKEQFMIATFIEAI